MELAPGVVTPGWFDLRPIVDRMPWPDVAGKRCLDVGTYDGFLAFELERRGAREVLATDLADDTAWDWPPDMRKDGAVRLGQIVGEKKGAGFEIARDALGSSVQREQMSVYDLSPERVGTFDVVICGSLLLHLEEPLRALEAIRGVCGGAFISAEQVRIDLSLMHPRRPLAQLNGSGEACQWWVPNAAGHRRMVFATGFRIDRATRPYSVPFGPAHPPPNGLRERIGRFARGLVTGNAGVPHAALEARPRV
jgi:tRNA (mo5U34)-methyltransferase